MKKQIIYILLALFCTSSLSCKKSKTAGPAAGETFFKIYNNSYRDFSSIFPSGNVVTDSAGNIYTAYFDTTMANDVNWIAILKTDKNGKILWNKRYFGFDLARRYDVTGDFKYNTYTTNFICIGSSLYLAGSDTDNLAVSVNTVLKFDCSDGTCQGRMTLFPDPVGSWGLHLSIIRGSSDGNIFVGSSTYYPTGQQIPGLFLLSKDRGVIWSKNDFIFNTGPGFYSETIEDILELDDGSIIVGTSRLRDVDTATIAVIHHRTLCFYHISSSGATLSLDTVPNGATYTRDLHNHTDDLILYNCSSLIGKFYLFRSGTGYLMAGNEVYKTGALRVKILKMSASFQIVDSGYINPIGVSCSISAIAQKPGGNLIVSVFQIPFPAGYYISRLFDIGTDVSVKSIGQVGLNSQSTFVSGINISADGHIIVSGAIDVPDRDKNNLFILKSDSYGNY